MPGDDRTDRELAELAALADGSLAPERRAEVEARVASSPRLQALLREQRAALEAVHGREERAPHRLHDAVARLHRPRLPIARRVALGAGLAVVVATVAVFALTGSEEAAPTLMQAAALAVRKPTSPRPSVPGAGQALAGVNAWGLEYPNLSRGQGWRPAGSRTDRIEGRTAKTVFYRRAGRRIAYTILAPGEVDAPKGAATWKRKGNHWYAFGAGGRTVVAWERHGHMCVVSVNGIGRRALVDLITR